MGAMSAGGLPLIEQKGMSMISGQTFKKGASINEMSMLSRNSGIENR